jgi:hypothetical protein
MREQGSKLSFDDIFSSPYWKANQVGCQLQKEWGNLGIRFKLIRELYDIVTPEIIERNGRIDPYFLDWCSVMTPIESNLWIDIRSNGLPFFPQYPVGRYFVDFGDPIKKIAVEADGKDWHDAERDKMRDSSLNELGWDVFRFTGAETYRLDVFDDMCRMYGVTPESDIKEDEYA